MNAFQIMELNQKLLDLLDAIAGSTDPFSTMDLNEQFNDIYDQINDTTSELSDLTPPATPTPNAINIDNTSDIKPPEYHKLQQLLSLQISDFTQLNAEENAKKFIELVNQQIEIATNLDNADLLEQYAPLALEVGEHIINLKSQSINLLINR